ncbi:hypothetical protein D3C86_1435930 [compost metagenome]
MVIREALLIDCNHIPAKKGTAVIPEGSLSDCYDISDTLKNPVIQVMRLVRYYHKPMLSTNLERYQLRAVGYQNNPTELKRLVKVATQ